MAAGNTPLASSSEIWSSPAWPNTWMSDVVETVGVPPRMATAPPLTRIVPAASRLMTMVLFSESPKTDSVCPAGENDAVTAGAMRSARGSRLGTKRFRQSFGRLDRELLQTRFTQDVAMTKTLQKGEDGQVRRHHGAREPMGRCGLATSKQAACLLAMEAAPLSGNHTVALVYERETPWRRSE